MSNPAQKEQETDPGDERKPAGQISQEAEPVDELYLPASQFVHDGAPESENDPAEQSEHMDPPDSDVFPAAHALQEDCPEADVLPASQLVHDLVLATDEYLPLAH